jgi:hypothetical protein
MIMLAFEYLDRPNCQLLFFDDFRYSEPKGYIANWGEESSGTRSEIVYSNYSLVSINSMQSCLVMNVPDNRSLQNKIYIKQVFRAESLNLTVKFRIENPQNEPNYAIFLFRSDGNGANHQEIDWEFSPSGLGLQQVTFYYDRAWPWSPHKIALDAPWDRISTYSEDTILTMMLEHDHISVSLSNSQGEFIKSFSVGSLSGGYDASDIRLYIETSAGLPSNIEGSYGLQREAKAGGSSKFLIDSVEMRNC